MLQVALPHLPLLQLNHHVNRLAQRHRPIADGRKVHAVRQDDRALEDVVEERLHDLVLAPVDQLIVQVEVALLADALQLHRRNLLLQHSERIAAQAADDRTADIGNVLPLLVRADAATNSIPCLEDKHLKAEELQLAGGDDAGDARPQDDHLLPSLGLALPRLKVAVRLVGAHREDAKVNVGLSLEKGVDAPEEVRILFQILLVHLVDAHRCDVTDDVGEKQLVLLVKGLEHCSK